MDATRDYHTKWSKSDRERQVSYDIAYIWNLKKWYEWTYLQNKNRVTDVEKQTYGYQSGRRSNKLGDWGWHIHTVYIHTYTYIHIHKIGN